MKHAIKGLLLVAVTACLAGGGIRAEDPWVVYDGYEGPGSGKHIVFISGDEEYRSEEALPQLAKILARYHGFTCTVLFAIDSRTGEINPNIRDHIPGLEQLDDADLMVIFTRFRDLPDEQMEHIVEYVNSGRPIIGLRTATHAFKFDEHQTYARYDYRSEEWPGGFGRQILGETWISHHGRHGEQSTRGLIAEGAEGHPILRGVEDGDIWVPTDVYTVRLPLPGDSQPLILGQVLEGMNPTDEPVEGEKNTPMLPVAWTKTYEGAHGETGRVFATTLGSSQGLQSEGLRRLFVNASYWALGMEDEITSRAEVDIVGEYNPTPFGFDGFKKGATPADYAMAEAERGRE